MKQQRGFTLIEMMLVITVIAVLAGLAVMTYRRHTITARVDKVALEMQQVLEAALAYNVDNNGSWPEERNGAICYAEKPNKDSTFIDNYIPNRNVQSSYGSYFCWAREDNNTHGRLFWVALKIPDNNRALGSRIAARLPNAILTADPRQTDQIPCDNNSICYVRSEVVQPAATSNNHGSGVNIVATGDCPSHNDTTNSNQESSTCKRDESYNGSGTKYQIDFAACSGNEMPRVTAFPNAIKFPKDNYPGFTVKNIYAERTQEPCTSSIENGKRRQVCNIVVHATTCVGAGPYHCNYIDIANAKHPGSVGASYMVACVPKDNSSF